MNDLIEDGGLSAPVLIITTEMMILVILLPGDTFRLKHTQRICVGRMAETYMEHDQEVLDICHTGTDPC